MKKSVITLHAVLPGSFRVYPLPGLYYSKDGADRMYSNQLWSAVTLYGGLMLAIALITRTFIRRIIVRYKRITAVIVGISLSGLTGSAALYFLSGFHIIILAAVTCCLGMLMGALSNRLLHAN